MANFEDLFHLDKYIEITAELELYKLCIKLRTHLQKMPR